MIVGHVDSKEGQAIFYRLSELKPGDTAKVTREDGKVAEYRIDALERVDKDRFPTEKVYGPLPYAGLRLITCGGRFDASTGHYTDNIIAYGHLSGP